MPSYLISKEAVNDINNIWIYTAENWSTEQADRYYNLILDEIEHITENFEMASTFENVRKGYRYSKVKSHLIFFKKTKDNKIEVIRVLHAKMDIENRLDEK